MIKVENDKKEVFAKDNWDYEKSGDDFEDRNSRSQERMVQKEKIFDNIPKDEGLEKDLSSERKNPGTTKITLNYMAEEIKKTVPLIRHDGNLYYYTGQSYKVLKDEEDLLRLTRSHVSRDAFGACSIKRFFSDLLIYLRNDDCLIPEEYEKKLRKAQYYISFRNGVLDVSNLELHRHSPKHLVFYELDSDWKENAYPKQFYRFLRTVCGADQEIQTRVLETIGYLLSPINEGKCFFVMGTAPDSGKSTLGEMLEKIVGEPYVTHLSTNQVGGRFALGDIHGKTLNLSMDLPKGKLSSVVVSIIKQITGGDAITAERKYDKLRDVHSKMRFLFASNYPVTIPKTDDDDSFWNRMVVVPFQYSLDKEEMDVCLIEKLMQEKDEIISVCLHALSELIKRNYIFSTCKVADEMKSQWREFEDESLQTVQKFFDECVEMTGNQRDQMYAYKLYRAYLHYCDDNQLECVSQKKMVVWIKQNMPDCIHKRIHETGENPKSGFSGIRFKDNDDV